MSPTVHLYRRQSANVMCTPCSAQPFFSDLELTEIALLSQATHTRRAADRDPAAAQTVDGSDGTWHPMHLVQEAAPFASMRSAADSTEPTRTIAGVVAVERTGTSAQIIAMRLVSRMPAA